MVLYYQSRQDDWHVHHGTAKYLPTRKSEETVVYQIRREDRRWTVYALRIDKTGDKWEETLVGDFATEQEAERRVQVLNSMIGETEK